MTSSCPGDGSERGNDMEESNQQSALSQQYIKNMPNISPMKEREEGNSEGEYKED